MLLTGHAAHRLSGGRRADPLPPRLPAHRPRSGAQRSISGRLIGGRTRGDDARGDGAAQRVLDAVDDEPRDPPGSEEWPEWSPTSEFRAVRERQRS